MIELLNSLAKLAYDYLLKQMVTPGGGIGIVEELGSGYSVEEERMEKAAKLRAICDEVTSDPTLLPKP